MNNSNESDEQEKTVIIIAGTVPSTFAVIVFAICVIYRCCVRMRAAAQAAETFVPLNQTDTTFVTSATSNEGVETTYATSETTDQNKTNDGTSEMNEQIEATSVTSESCEDEITAVKSTLLKNSETSYVTSATGVTSFGSDRESIALVPLHHSTPSKHTPSLGLWLNNILSFILRTNS